MIPPTPSEPADRSGPWARPGPPAPGPQPARLGPGAGAAARPPGRAGAAAARPGAPGESGDPRGCARSSDRSEPEPEPEPDTGTCGALEPLPGDPPGPRPSPGPEPRRCAAALAWALALLALSSVLGPERGLGGALPWGSLAESGRGRLLALGLPELAPGPLERLRRDPAAPLSAREWRALPGIGLRRAAEIEAARRAAGGPLDWRRLDVLTGIGAGTLERLVRAIEGPGPASGAARSGAEPRDGPAPGPPQRLSWPR